MACPHCGGMERRAISPGFWECTSLLYGEVPTGLPPSGQFGPVFQTVAHPCGRRYQEGAPGGSGMLCQTCTVFAIGICADCGIPQCGNCGGHYRGAFLCARCQQARAAAERAAAEQAAADAARQKATAAASAGQLANARLAWLRAVGHTLEAQVRRTHRAGWAVEPATEQWVTTQSGSHDGFTYTNWVESQLIVTPAGELQQYKRRKPKQTSRRWKHEWTEPVSQGVWGLSGVAAYIRTQYGVSVPEIDA